MPKETQSISSLTTETLLKVTTIPEPVRHTFLKTVGHMETNEQLMWREVAARMVLDAYGVTPEATRVFDGMDEGKFQGYRRTVNKARRWFLAPREAEDSSEVFTLWGGDIGPVRESVRALPPVAVPKFFHQRVRVAA